jgi:protoporphyrinogen oxidase
VVHAFAKGVKGHIETGWEVASIRRDDTNEHWYVMSKSGEERLYHELISTMPVHDLLNIWPEAPAAARDALGKLRYNSLINVLLGFSEDRDLPYTAIYVPDPDLIFHRLSFPKAFSEHCVPKGSSSLMAEITANEGDGVWEMSDDAIIERTIADAAKSGLIDPATVTYRRVVRFLYGYPVYDLDYRANVTELREAIRGAGIHLLGRFGEFDYINSDVCVERAMALADTLSNG